MYSPNTICRLVRFMIIGLLDKRWETRHGCSLGLMGLLQGLGLVIDPSLNLIPRTDGDSVPCSGQNSGLVSAKLDVSTAVSSSSPSSSSSPPSSNFSSILYSSSLPLSLPRYLVEDIICTGLCLLMLDRFIDLSTSSSISISPAREVRM